MTPPPTRAQRLDAAAVALADGARRAAQQGELTRAMHLLAVADAVGKAARGDSLGRRLALKDARVMRRAMPRRAMQGGAA